MSLTKKALTPHSNAEKYRVLIEINADPLVIINTEGLIIDTNEAVVHLTGIEHGQLINSALSEYFTEPEKISKVLQTVLLNGSVNNIPLELICRESTTEVHLSGLASKDEDGNPTEAVIVLRDTTTQKTVEEQTAHLGAIVTSSNDAIISKGLDGVIKVWNKSAEKIFGYSAAEAISQPISIIIPPDKINEENTIIQKIEQGEYIEQYETLRKRKDGEIINVSISVSPIKDASGKIKGISEVAREITEQKRFEKELIEARRNAERDKKLAEEAVEAKQAFLSNMSHEIRTPLNAIIGFTKVVLKTKLDEKQKEYLDAIKVSGDALIVLINDILDLAKFEAGKMTFEQIPFKLYDSISSMLHLFETKLMQKNVALVKNYDSNIPDVLVGDPVRLHQIILNLVSNAIKFTSKGQITVSVK
ncbi:MAG: histidine kinase, partial [Bacteroidetes bacterium]|nr:histidine kinase [Bacteroidota bacterium]